MEPEKSEFWKDLGSKHAAELSRHGLDSVKRVQALRYFTWRWTLSRWRTGSQGRYLLRHSSFATWLKALITPNDLSRAAWAPADWSLPDRMLYVFATRLLWEVARTEGSAAVLALEEPHLGAPFPVTWRERLISQDLANTALEVASIREGLGQVSPHHIVEVGAGYGRTAHALLSIYPTASYTIIDIQPALDISRWYLSNLFPDREIAYVDAMSQTLDHQFDLAISISTLAEMSRTEVERYKNLFAEKAEPGGVVYLKQWERWFNPVDRVEHSFSDFAPPGGIEVFRRHARVQVQFLEAAWRMP